MGGCISRQGGARAQPQPQVHDRDLAEASQACIDRMEHGVAQAERRNKKLRDAVEDQGSMTDSLERSETRSQPDPALYQGRGS